MSSRLPDGVGMYEYCLVLRDYLSIEIGPGSCPIPLPQALRGALNYPRERGTIIDHPYNLCLIGTVNIVRILFANKFTNVSIVRTSNSVTTKELDVRTSRQPGVRTVTILNVRWHQGAAGGMVRLLPSTHRLITCRPSPA